MESDRNLMIAFAESLSSESITVGVPRMTEGEADVPGVDVTPTPQCPYCGAECRSSFGYPPDQNKPKIAPKSAAEFRDIPISMADLSVRSRRICQELFLYTLGQLEDARSRFVSHPRVTESSVLEIDKVLAMKPKE